MDLSRLAPAPWKVRVHQGVFVSMVEHSSKEDETCQSVCIGVDRADAEFIALARNAYDVMLRRGRSPMLVAHPEDEDRWGWKVFSSGRNGYVGPDVARLYEDPFAALVEADRWCAENGSTRRAPQE